MSNKKFTSNVRPSTPIFVGKKPKFLNLIHIQDENSFELLPLDVRKAVHPIDESSFKVDSLEYSDGEILNFGCFVAWEKTDPAEHTEEEMARIPAGYNLWNKANALQQMLDGVLEEVDGKFRLTKIVPLKAQLFSGEIPEIFESQPRFDGQVTVNDGKLFIETPWGISDGTAGNCFAVVYGLGSSENEKFFGKLDGNILTVGTPSFEDYYHVTEDGQIIETLHEYFDNLKYRFAN